MSTAVLTADRSHFFADLRQARQRVLLLDYDGTVAPFSVDRKRAFPYPTVPELLDCIMSTCRTRVALISGRAAHELLPLLRLNPPPEIWGTHGAERLQPGGRYDVAPSAKKAVDAVMQADAELEKEGLSDRVELKPGSIAVHWRGLSPSQIHEVRTRAYRVLLPISEHSGLLLCEFDAGLEMRTPSPDKADAARAILSEVRPGAAVAYLGDDMTDEDAFAALNGIALTVLVRPEFRPTVAQMWIRPPEELTQFLTDWVRACGGDV